VINIRTKISLDDSNSITALNILESQDETKFQAFIFKAFYLMKHKQYEEAINVLELALENSEAWLLFGKIYWNMGDYNHSLMAFLNGVRRDRNNWECLIYLGHYYREHSNDIERSRRCYHAALQINPNSEEAGIGLSTAYRLLKNTVSIITFSLLNTSLNMT
jgi:tetratricopeptide (TPR) repeat protein